MPRAHVTDMWSLEAKLAANLMAGVVRVGSAIREALNPDGMNLINSSGSVAEQTVAHLHFHIVPRYEGDRMSSPWPSREPLEEGLRREIFRRIWSACATGSSAAMPIHSLLPDAVRPIPSSWSESR